MYEVCAGPFYIRIYLPYFIRCYVLLHPLDKGRVYFALTLPAFSLYPAPGNEKYQEDPPSQRNKRKDPDQEIKALGCG